MILRNGQGIDGTVLLSSVRWTNPGTGVATVRDSKGSIIAELSARDPYQFFGPPRPVQGLTVEAPSGEIELTPLQMDRKMAAINALPPGTPGLFLG